MSDLFKKIDEAKKNIEKLETAISSDCEKLDDTVTEFKDNLSQKKQEILDGLNRINEEAENLRDNLIKRSSSAKQRLWSALSVLDYLPSIFSKILALLFAGIIISFITLNVMVETGIGIPFGEILPLTKGLSYLIWLYRARLLQMGFVSCLTDIGMPH